MCGILKLTYTLRSSLMALKIQQYAVMYLQAVVTRSSQRAQQAVSYAFGICERVKPQLLELHFNWLGYIAVHSDVHISILLVLLLVLVLVFAYNHIPFILLVHSNTA